MWAVDFGKTPVSLMNFCLEQPVYYYRHASVNEQAGRLNQLTLSLLMIVIKVKKSIYSPPRLLDVDPERYGDCGRRGIAIYQLCLANYSAEKV